MSIANFLRSREPPCKKVLETETYNEFISQLRKMYPKVGDKMFNDILVEAVLDFEKQSPNDQPARREKIMKLFDNRLGTGSKNIQSVCVSQGGRRTRRKHTKRSKRTRRH
jgi:hypothetical protein